MQTRDGLGGVPPTSDPTGAAQARAGHPGAATHRRCASGQPRRSRVRGRRRCASGQPRRSRVRGRRRRCRRRQGVGVQPPLHGPAGARGAPARVSLVASGQEGGAAAALPSDARPRQWRPDATPPYPKGGRPSGRAGWPSASRWGARGAAAVVGGGSRRGRDRRNVKHESHLSRNNSRHGNRPTVWLVVAMRSLAAAAAIMDTFCQH